MKSKNIVFITFSVFILLGALLTGCKTNNVIHTNNVPHVDDSGATNESVNSVVAANNQFAFELYSKYNSEEGNIFFSPYSISTALAMTYEGARGKTAEEMQSVFHFPTDNISRRAGFAKVYNEINKKDKEYLLSTANALWAQNDYKFLADYFSVTEGYYGGKVTNLDFKKDAEGSRVTINNWVEKQTNNRIKELLPKSPPVITRDTRLVLTNAIYFKGTWAKQFDKKNTEEKDFRTDSGNIVKAQMMSLTGEKAEFNYTETEQLQALELPYKGGELSMLILLPKNGTLSSIEESITSEEINEMRKALRNNRVDIYIPKFKFDTKYFMAKTLKEMGMPTAFSYDADFSGMTGNRDLYISNVIHQAFVEVNEEGTEAAATAVVMTRASVEPMRNKVFNADHPFIFIIQEKSTGNILFLGRVSDPTK